MRLPLAMPRPQQVGGSSGRDERQGAHATPQMHTTSQSVRPSARDARDMEGGKPESVGQLRDIIGPAGQSATRVRIRKPHARAIGDDHPHPELVQKGIVDKTVPGARYSMEEQAWKSLRITQLGIRESPSVAQDQLPITTGRWYDSGSLVFRLDIHAGFLLRGGDGWTISDSIKTKAARLTPASRTTPRPKPRIMACCSARHIKA